MDPGHRTGVLNSSVLVLNRFYTAVHVVSVRRAFILLFRELAEVVDIDSGRFASYDFAGWSDLSAARLAAREPHEDWIRTVSSELQVPRVIRLTGFERVPRQTLRFNRRNLLARDNHRCQYCGRGFPSHQLSLDHVVPRSRGGPTSWENIVCSCLECNTKKGGRTPHEARMRLLRRPAKPRHNPVLATKLCNPKYAAWKTFLPTAALASEMHE